MNTRYVFLFVAAILVLGFISAPLGYTGQVSYNVDTRGSRTELNSIGDRNYILSQGSVPVYGTHRITQYPSPTATGLVAIYDVDEDGAVTPEDYVLARQMWGQTREQNGVCESYSDHANANDDGAPDWVARCLRVAYINGNSVVDSEDVARIESAATTKGLFKSVSWNPMQQQISGRNHCSCESLGRKSCSLMGDTYALQDTIYECTELYPGSASLDLCSYVQKTCADGMVCKALTRVQFGDTIDENTIINTAECRSLSVSTY